MCFDAQGAFKIQGVDGEILNNIKMLLNSEYGDCIDTNTRQKDLESSLNDLIEQATQPFGYYTPSFDLNLNNSSVTCLNVSMKINLNTPIRIESQTIVINGDGKDTDYFNAVLEQYPQRVDDILVDKHYQTLKSQLKVTAEEYGYIQAEFEKNQILLSKKSSTANIQLVFNTGKRHQLSSIIVQQSETFLSPTFVKGLIRLKENDTFTRTQLFNTRQQLMDTGYFSSVSLSLQRREAKDGKVPLVITLLPKDKLDYSFGVGFSTDTKARLRFDYNNYRVNQTGYQYNAKFGLSEVIKEFSSGLKIPSETMPATHWYNFDIGYKQENTDLNQSDTTKIGASMTHVLDSGWKLLNFVDLVYDEFDTGLQDDNSLIIVPGINVSYVNANDYIRPSKGYRLQLEAKGSHESIGSDATFIQLSSNYKGISTLAARHRLLYRLHLGVTFTSDLNQLPLDYRFFAGGDNSVRGFDYKSISPQNTAGDFIGGKHSVIASLEYDYQFTDQWAMALFIDSGSAFSDQPDFKTSAGVGLRWLSPVGPIRFDLATPLVNAKNQFRVHISLGPDL